jgi:hypothetical protein
LSQNYYHNGNDHKTYDVATLIQHAKEKAYPVFNLPLAGLDLETMPFSVDDMDEFIWHMARVQDASLEYPILLSHKGAVMDGWHRICKAILNKCTHIKAIRFVEPAQASHEEQPVDKE